MTSKPPTSVAELGASLDVEAIGAALHQCIVELFPICRSITGDGVRQTLARLGERIPLIVHEVSSGTPAFDWTIPLEWNIRDAYIKNSRGERVVDFRRSNLHVMSYSVPVHARIRLAELRPHLFSLADHPEWIPYRTSYYTPNWGFCLSHRQLLSLSDDEYEVRIDATLEPGGLTYAECVLPGESDDEILISCHACHPSLANDNLSGMAIAALLAAHLGRVTRRYSYRFLFIPGTIGSLAWLSRNEARLPGIKHGLVLACLGDAGPFTYKKSRRGDAEIDRVAAHVLRQSDAAHQIAEFSPYGYDERQFCSPGIDLPVGCLMRTPHGRFPEYHTSADNLDFVQPRSLAGSFATCLKILSILEANVVYVNQVPKGEPQLGRRGLYRAVGGPEGTTDELAMLWVLNLSDGRHSLLDIAERSGYRFEVVQRAADLLRDHGLLKASSGCATMEDPAS